MNRLSKLLTVLPMICGAMIAFSACNGSMESSAGDDETGGGDILEYYYSLESGVHHGDFSDEELATIASYHNAGMNFLDTLTELDARIIQETVAEKARDRDGHLDAKADDYEILNYYGRIGGYMVFIVRDPYIDVPDEAIDEWVEYGSVKIHYTSPYRISFMVGNVP